MTLINRLLITLLLALFLWGCEAEVPVSGGYAVVYGISLYDPEYEEGAENTLNLTYSNDDAVSVAAMFEDANYNVLLRTDTQATVENLAADIAYVSERISSNENFVFYFSGHGVGARFSGYEAGDEPAGRDANDEWIFLYGSIDNGHLADIDAALSDDGLLTMIDHLPTSRRIVVLDACNSGGFIGSEAEIDLLPQNSAEDAGEGFIDAVKKYFDGAVTGNADIPSSKALLITAAGEQEDTYEAEALEHGIFTYYFLNAPFEGDSNGDGYVTVGECFYYTSTMIETEWESFFSPRISGGAVDIVLFKSTGY